MDQKQRRSLFSHDVVFDKVSSFKFDVNEGKGIADLALFPNDSTSYSRGSNISLVEENIQSNEVTEAVTRKLMRQRK